MKTIRIYDLVAGEVKRLSGDTPCLAEHDGVITTPRGLSVDDGDVFGIEVDDTANLETFKPGSMLYVWDEPTATYWASVVLVG